MLCTIYLLMKMEVQLLENGRGLEIRKLASNACEPRVVEPYTA